MKHSSLKQLSNASVIFQKHLSLLISICNEKKCITYRHMNENTMPLYDYHNGLKILPKSAKSMK